MVVIEDESGGNVEGSFTSNRVLMRGQVEEPADDADVLVQHLILSK